ncbi:type III restriction endonuclease subunit R, partial [Psittacicella melopsittaci]
MTKRFLYEELESILKYDNTIELPEIIQTGLAPRIALREYQEQAFKSFVTYYENEQLRKEKQVHTLFHMATGSGKTVIMAGLILYLYTKGYRKFLFFVNQTNVLEKTIENFINTTSSKYLFNEVIESLGKRIKIKKVTNFSGNNLDDDIEIIFTTTQKLHLDLALAKENSITYEDFKDHQVVFISDESHHINSSTKKPTKDELQATKSWETSVMTALRQNKDSMMLEFTATCDLKDSNVLEKYRDKIVFNYPLIAFRTSGYTKDFKNLASDTDLWTRALIALIISEYRKFLFADLKINIKPVLMLKSQKIAESEAFYEEFFTQMKKLTATQIKDLETSDIEVLNQALQYFQQQDPSYELLGQSLRDSFTQETSIIMKGTSDNNREKQLLVKSLEDQNNPI